MMTLYTHRAVTQTYSLMQGESKCNVWLVTHNYYDQINELIRNYESSNMHVFYFMSNT